MTKTTDSSTTTFTMEVDNDKVTVIERFAIPDSAGVAEALDQARRHIAEHWRPREDYTGSLLMRHRVEEYNIFSGAGDTEGLAMYSRWRSPAGGPPSTVPSEWSLTALLPQATVLSSRTYKVDFTESLTEGDTGTPVSIAAAPIAHMGVFVDFPRGQEALLERARVHSKESFAAGGVVGVNFHVSLDGQEAVNVGQWTTVEHLPGLAQQDGFGAVDFYWKGVATIEGMFFDLVEVDLPTKTAGAR